MARKDGRYCQKYEHAEITKYKNKRWFCVCSLKAKFKIRKCDTIRVCAGNETMWDLRPDEALRISSMLALTVAKQEESKVKKEEENERNN
jgi:hypothetical protein